MIENLSKEIFEKIEQVFGSYHRLVLLVAPAGAGKTAVLKKVLQDLDVPFLNLNLEISRRMLDLTERQRALQVHILLEDILREADNEVVILDNIEILFEVSLRQDPLRLLQGISRNRTIVAAWNGEIKDKTLTYATPEHPEYRRYPANELILTEILPNF